MRGPGAVWPDTTPVRSRETMAAIFSGRNAQGNMTVPPVRPGSRQSQSSQGSQEQQGTKRSVALANLRLLSFHHVAKATQVFPEPVLEPGRRQVMVGLEAQDGHLPLAIIGQARRRPEALQLVQVELTLL